MKNPHHRNLAILDEHISAFRRYYEAKKPKFRKKLRDWLKKFVSVMGDAPIGISVDTFLWDEPDADGIPTLVSERWKNALPPETMLKAIKAWDAGETYCPETPS